MQQKYLPHFKLSPIFERCRCLLWVGGVMNSHNWDGTQAWGSKRVGVNQEWYKTDITMGWIFYPEQHHSDITWNEHEKFFCVPVTGSLALKTFQQQTYSVHQSKRWSELIISWKKVVWHWLNVTTNSTWLSSIAPIKWQFKMWEVFLSQPVCVCVCACVRAGCLKKIDMKCIYVSYYIV